MTSFTINARTKLLAALLVALASVAPAISAAPAAVVGDGLASYWRLDETASPLSDVLGVHSLTASGLTYPSTGNIQNGAIANGGGISTAATGTSPQIGFGTHSSFTLAGWIYPSYITGTAWIFAKGTSSPLWMLFRRDDTICATVRYTGVVAELGCVGSVAQNQWAHVAYVVDGSNVTVAVNGVGATYTLTGTVLVGTTAIYFSNPSSTGTRWNGRFDEWGYWSRALTANEITALSDPACFYPFSACVVLEPTPMPTPTPAASPLSFGSLDMSVLFAMASLIVNALWNALAVIGGITVGVWIVQRVADSIKHSIGH